MPVRLRQTDRRCLMREKEPNPPSIPPFPIDVAAQSYPFYNELKPIFLGRSASGLAGAFDSSQSNPDPSSLMMGGDDDFGMGDDSALTLQSAYENSIENSIGGLEQGDMRMDVDEADNDPSITTTTSRNTAARNRQSIATDSSGNRSSSASSSSSKRRSANQGVGEILGGVRDALKGLGEGGGGRCDEAFSKMADTYQKQMSDANEVKQAEMKIKTEEWEIKKKGMELDLKVKKILAIKQLTDAGIDKDEAARMLEGSE